jgi:hypothetical protein
VGGDPRLTVVRVGARRGTVILAAREGTLTPFVTTRWVFFLSYAVVLIGISGFVAQIARSVAGPDVYQAVGLAGTVLAFIVSGLAAERAAQRNVWSYQPFGAAWIGGLTDLPMLLSWVPLLGPAIRARWADPPGNNPYEPPGAP